MSHEISQVRRKLLTTRTTADELVDYLLGRTDAQPTPKMAALLERLRTCADLIRRYGSKKKVVEAMVNHQRLLGDAQYSLATAYRDFDDTTRVFGTTKQSSRDFYVDDLLEKMYESRRTALAAGKLKEVAAIEANILKTLQVYFGETDTIDWEKVQPAPRIIGFMPEELAVSLPADWKQQVEQIVKKRRATSFADEDAQEVTE